MSKKYKQQDIIDNFIKLTQELGHEPTVFEVDACEYLPPSRTIQRRMGGLQELRRLTGQSVINHTQGATRSAKADVINKRAKRYEAELYNLIRKKYHDISGTTTFVTREWSWQQALPDGREYSNTRCDVCIDNRETGHHIVIDFFYPESEHSLGGCVRAKQKKLRDNPVALLEGATHEVMFVCVNPDFHQDDIKNKDTYSLEEFKSKLML